MTVKSCLLGRLDLLNRGRLLQIAIVFDDNRSFKNCLLNKTLFKIGCLLERLDRDDLYGLLKETVKSQLNKTSLDQNDLCLMVC